MFVNLIITLSISSRILEVYNYIIEFLNNFSTLSIFYAINTLIVLTIIFLESQKASSSWAWILVLLLIPYLGLILYLILGRPIYREKIFPYSKQEKIEFQKSLLETSTPYNISKEEDVKYRNRNLIALNYHSDQSFLSENNKISIITSGDEKFKLLFEDIRNAKEYIHIQYYILKKDNIGKELFDLLIQKLNENVKVYILYDDIGSRTLNKYTLKKLIDAGAKVKSFFKSSLPLINLRMNYRNHRKIVVIDGKIGYTGGFNVGDEYLGKDRKLGYWRDTHIRIVGDAVATLNFRFIDDWNSQVLRKKQNELIDLNEKHLYNYEKNTGNIPIQVVTSGPDDKLEQIKYGYLHMINRARQYIYIQTPYFIPDESVIDALKMAILSGIDVRIMIPSIPDHILVRWGNYSYVGELANVGAKIYEYKKGFLHAKTIIIDDEVTSVGSANFDNRSFKLNFEINTFIYDKETTQKFRNIFNNDIRNSKLLTKEKYNNRKLTIKFKEALARLISPIL
ncbi:cardiolipin synthase [Gemella sp. GH3]|uniref:cardiolipin synthase n=1 Tax=unclassified Gemella TaxID=2624949 RepID=UPI0015D02945|nr:MULTISPECIES: cardiolipin synthase [unclassified Gemella]MBF0714628.1 cardiolipin synthase [Gemella sp. GH3.1]NYS51580.1 cardiolipin synthase [Gemella sp. GH3]